MVANDSPFSRLAKFHNQVKLHLLTMYSKKFENPSLVDIGSGWGQDTSKWRDCKIRSVLATTFDFKDIKEFDKRIKKIKDFEVDIYYIDLRLNVLAIPDKVSMVTSFFSFHYFFDKEKSFTKIITSVSQVLVTGGYFIGCCFSSDNVIKFVNQEIDIPGVTISVTKYDKKEIYGNKLKIKMAGTIIEDGTTEFLINRKKFIDLVEEKGFEVVENVSFNKFYDDNKPTVDLTDDEKQISFLNFYFVFVKK